MKAISYTAYGPPTVLRLAELDAPTPRDHEVRIRVRAAALNPLDAHFVRGTPYLVRMMTGLRKPRAARLGVDVAGRVESVGRSVTRLQPGDEVFGTCKGAFAEYACASADALVPKPGRVTFEQAAAVPVAASSALQGLRDRGRIQRGQEVLINGAAGGVGTFAVQIARSFGTTVTGVCSARNADLVRSIGADRVIDYAREDFTRTGRRYDLILDMIGNHSLLDCRRALTTGGTLVMVGAAEKGGWGFGLLTGMLKAAVLSRFVRQKFRPFLANPSLADLTVLRQMLETGTIAPVIDRSFPLSGVPDAIQYLEEGHARGKVVITMAAGVPNVPA